MRVVHEDRDASGELHADLDVVRVEPPVTDSPDADEEAEHDVAGDQREQQHRDAGQQVGDWFAQPGGGHRVRAGAADHFAYWAAGIHAPGVGRAGRVTEDLAGGERRVPGRIAIVVRDGQAAHELGTVE